MPQLMITVAIFQVCQNSVNWTKHQGRWKNTCSLKAAGLSLNVFFGKQELCLSVTSSFMQGGFQQQNRLPGLLGVSGVLGEMPFSWWSSLGATMKPLGTVRLWEITSLIWLQIVFYCWSFVQDICFLWQQTCLNRVFCKWWSINVLVLKIYDPVSVG